MVRKNLESSPMMTGGRGSCTDIVMILANKKALGLKPEIEDLQKKELDAFKETLAAYSGATGGEDQLDDKADDSE